MLPPSDPPPGRAASPVRMALAWTTGVAILLLVPVSILPPEPAGLAPLPLDKLVHALLFFGLGRVWRRARPEASRIATILLLVAYGGALELLQGALGVRTAEWGDLAADALGAAVAGWIPFPL